MVDHLEKSKEALEKAYNSHTPEGNATLTNWAMAHALIAMVERLDEIGPLLTDISQSLRYINS